MKYFQKIIIFIAIYLIVNSCSTKKDTFVSRNFHTLTTKYNVLFNGKELFKKGIEKINKTYKDNYWRQLPIEPIEFSKETKIDAPKFTNDDSGGFAGFGASSKTKEKEEKKPLTTFEKAEEKAVKAIQKHSMHIEGIERNSQIDDAYLLLGKTRYYSQRFIPAIEAFNYVIANYPSANLINETKIWRAKANIRIDNEEFAIESLKLLVENQEVLEEKIPEEIKEQAHTALAMAYVKTDSLQKAKKHLIKATETQNDVEQSARNLFVLGQLYSFENKKDSASLMFKKLAERKKTPYKYKIHANIALAKNFSNDSSSTALIKKMHKLIKNRNNRPFLDELYYQLAYLYESKDSTKTAKIYYNKSLRTKVGSSLQKTYTFEKLGNIYFKESEYLLASAYYDSVLKSSKDSLDLRIRRVKRKYKNLASLIKYEEILAVNDSILSLVALTPEKRKLYFEEYIEKIKKEDKEKEQQKLNEIAFSGSFGGNTLQSNNKGKWYFYNTQSIQFGKTEFQKIWGNRALADNWRWSSKIENNIEQKDSSVVSTKNLRYDLEGYLKSIPTEITAIDSLKANRNQALYELGIIYKEQFKNTELAVQRLERVASLKPTEKLILPIHWHLYQIYKDKGDIFKINKYKSIIVENYPDTKFAQIIQFPNKELKEKTTISALETTYKELYYLYKKNKFEKTETKINELLPEIQNTKLVPKFELLKAYAIGKHQNIDAYRAAMEYVAINYASSEEGKKAKQIVTKLTK